MRNVQQPESLTLPSGIMVLHSLAPSNFAPSIFAPFKLAPFRLAALKLAPDKSAPSRLVSRKKAFKKLAPFSLASDRLVFFKLALSKFVESLDKSIQELKLSAEQESELRAEVETIKSQLASPKPKTTILSECGISIRSILEKAGGTAVGSLLAELTRTVF